MGSSVMNAADSASASCSGKQMRTHDVRQGKESQGAVVLPVHRLLHGRQRAQVRLGQQGAKQVPLHLDGLVRLQHGQPLQLVPQVLSEHHDLLRVVPQAAGIRSQGNPGPASASALQQSLAQARGQRRAGQHPCRAWICGRWHEDELGLRGHGLVPVDDASEGVHVVGKGAAIVPP